MWRGRQWERTWSNTRLKLNYSVTFLMKIKNHEREMEELCAAEGASDRGVLWRWLTVQMTEEIDHHLYAKPLVSRCVKGQLFNKAAGPGQSCAWETRLHPGTSAQPFKGKSTQKIIQQRLLATLQSAATTPVVTSWLGCRQKSNMFGGFNPNRAVPKLSVNHGRLEDWNGWANFTLAVTVYLLSTCFSPV